MKKVFPLLVIVFFAIACKKGQLPPVKRQYYFHNVLFLGNAITIAPPGPTRVWGNNWGMAATVADSDYVHILTRNFLHQYSKCDTAVKNIGDFELKYNDYDFDFELQSYRDSKPDLIIIRIGENLDPNITDFAAFGKRYSELITYLKTGNPNVTICAAGSFWPGRSQADSVMRQYTPFVSLSKLGGDLTNYSFGLYADPTVEDQPSNKGMKAIATTILKSVDSLRATLAPIY